MMLLIGRELFAFHKEKSNKTKESWWNKAARTQSRNRAKMKDPTNQQSTFQLPQPTTAFKKHLLKLTENAAKLSPKIVTKNNLKKIIVPHSKGGMEIKEIETVDVTIPDGVDRECYKQQLKLEVEYRTTARKSTTKKRKKVFGRKKLKKQKHKPKKT